jgi:colanic acid/amylovoran biosynthesis glycosyltransferase
MKTILFLTNAYPYFPGEQFIEDEIGYWATQTAAKVILVPMTASGTPRSTPEEIDVDLTLAQSGSLLEKLSSVVTAACSKLFWKEVGFIYTSRGLTLRCYVRALKSSANVLRIKKALHKVHAKHQNVEIAYCYWNDVQAYAAVLLKRAGMISKVVSRAHRFDLYENRRLDQYMPLKRQFIAGMDLTFAIANEGKIYLEMTYGLPATRVLVSPLGVPIPSLISQASESNCLNIVSVSFCAPVKRIDKIIDVIAAAALQLKTYKITWNHIGDGPLLSDLMLHAAEKLTPQQVEWSFLGNKKNSEVKQYFENNCVDIFINASESEGVPVSIMEAMSYGIPVIAPNVGGISELVANEYGCLLSDEPSVSDIATAFVGMASRCKQPEIRALAKQKIVNNYSAAQNYHAFVDSVIAKGPNTDG